MPAAHVFESAFRNLIHAYAEYGRSPLRVPILVAAEGGNDGAGIGWMTLEKTPDGFTVTFTKAGKQ